MCHGGCRYLGATLASGAKIQLCGNVVVEIDGRRVEGELPGRQGLLLFAYLATHRGRSSSRDRLIDAIWPRGSPAAAEGALSALLSKLRRVLGESILSGRSEVRLRLGEGAFVDLEAAGEAIHRAESAVARELWREAWGPSRVALHTANREFLPGLDAPWIDEQRRELEDVRLRALECVAGAGLGLGGPEIAATERAGRRLTELAPYRESGYRYLMEALERGGNVAEAVLVYDRIRRLLREELGIAPGEEIQVVHGRLLERRAT